MQISFSRFVSVEASSVQWNDNWWCVALVSPAWFVNGAFCCQALQELCNQEYFILVQTCCSFSRAAVCGSNRQYTVLQVCSDHGATVTESISGCWKKGLKHQQQLNSSGTTVLPRQCLLPGSLGYSLYAFISAQTHFHSGYQRRSVFSWKKGVSSIAGKLINAGYI